MQKPVPVRNITTQDVAALVDLYDSVWPKSAGTYEGKTAWMLSRPEFYGICAYDGDKLIGSRPSFYSNMYFGAKKLKAVQCGLSCVHEDYRRFGIFSTMNKAFLEKYFVEDKNDLIYNISVLASKIAYEKLGWVYIDSLTKLIYIPNFIKILWKLKFNIKKISGGVNYNSAPKPDLKSFDLSLLEIREQYFRKAEQIHTYYDENYLDWRLKSESNIEMLMLPEVGAIFYKTGRRNALNVVTIGEVFLYDYNKKSFRKMIKHLKNKYKADIIEIAITEAHPCYTLYKQMGFMTNPLKKYLYFGVKAVAAETQELALNPKNWALSTLDIDTF